MSKVMLDTNILLDYILPDRPESEYARLLMKDIAQQKHRGFVSVSSLKDLYYLAVKSIGEQAARDWVCIFMRLCDIEELDVEVCAIAAESDEPDLKMGASAPLPSARRWIFSSRVIGRRMRAHG